MEKTTLPIAKTTIRGLCGQQHLSNCYSAFYRHRISLWTKRYVLAFNMYGMTLQNMRFYSAIRMLSSSSVGVAV